MPNRRGRTPMNAESPSSWLPVVLSAGAFAPEANAGGIPSAAFILVSLRAQSEGAGRSRQPSMERPRGTQIAMLRNPLFGRGGAHPLGVSHTPQFTWDEH